MHALTRWFIHNPVAANLIMGLILVAGIFTLMNMRIEGFPKLPADTIQIQTAYAGAQADQVDRLVTRKIEKSLEGQQGVKSIRSTSLDGFSSVLVQKNEGYSLQRLLDDVRIRLDGVAGFPRDATRPVIGRNDFDFSALIVQLYGTTDTQTLQRLGEQVRQELLSLPEVSKLNVWGKRQSEISIDVTPQILESYGLSIADIIVKIQQSSLSFNAGVIKTEGARIVLRADSKASFAREFAQIPIVENDDGSVLLLSDLGSVSEKFPDDEIVVRFNGQPALGMEVLIGRDENLLKIAVAVKARIAQIQTTFPEEVTLSVWADSSGYISERLGMLRSNAFQGLLFVFLLLALFLNLKLAFWVAMGIPISIAGAMAVMGSSWVDYSLNDITTFGLIIALGILVDDAVVVGESVFEERKNYSDPLEGTQKGVRRVATATIYGVLTTVAAFFPMMLIESALGKIMASFAGVVILALLFSLFESKFILPAHLAYISLERPKNKNWISKSWSWLQGRFQGGLEGFNQRIYRPVLVWCLHQRYAVLIVFISFATLGIGLIGTGQIKSVFFPDIPGQLITVNMEMDARAPYALTLGNADRIENVAKELNEELRLAHSLAQLPIADILVVVSGAFSVNIYAELSPPDKRAGLATLEIVRQWQERVGRLEGTSELVFSGAEESGGGFELQLFGKDVDSLRAATLEVMNYLAGIEGVSNLRDALKNGKPELRLRLKPEARLLGFTQESLATQIGQRFGGAEAQRVQREQFEIRVMVRDRQSARDSLSALMNTRLKNDEGQWFSLEAVVDIESSYATDYIARRDGKRVNSIRAFVDKNAVSPSEILQAFSQDIGLELARKYPDVEIKGAGELEEMETLKGGLIRALIFTALLIYALLAIPLKSYWQPFIIMSVIPFGFVGAAIGHLIMDLPLSLLSFFGMLALAGVVVNDSLVMMTRYNQTKAEGASVHDALQDAGVGRFKAIFLTTTTTVAGLTPLMLETSEQAQYLIPAAVSLAFGEIFATAITLILVPVLIAISIDVMSFFGFGAKVQPAS